MSPSAICNPPRLTLGQFAASIVQAIQNAPYSRGAWVMAELSDVRYRGGHCYMELVEKSPSGQVVAKMRANIWQGSLSFVRHKFLSATGRDISTGIKVMLFGIATYHAAFGLSFNVGDIDPNYTLGDIERIRREILDKLAREGVADSNKRLTMPMAPQRIAVISAEGAAGYGDFMNHLVANQQGFVFYTRLIPAVLQGERTSASVRQALDFVERTLPCWDCVAILRGGGATTDLIGFDEYELARRVATFPIPVVVGIGHERDRTVLDEIAHTRVKTPTAAAAYFIDSLAEACRSVTSLVDQIARYGNDRLVGEGRRLANFDALVPALANGVVERARGLLEREMSRMPVVVESRISREKTRMESFGKILEMASSQRVGAASKRLEEMAQRLMFASASQMKAASGRLESLEGLVKVLSPDNTLRRGYSITRVGGKAIKNASELPAGAKITTILYDGEIESEVVTTKNTN